MRNDLLFIYGTLLHADNEFAVYLRQNSEVFCAGKFKGWLYDIGHYPGAIADSAADSFVHGSIVKLNNAADVLKKIDPYEGYGEGQPRPYLYLRKLIKSETETGDLECWVYLYNHRIEGLTKITSGDYTSYIKIKNPSRLI